MNPMAMITPTHPSVTNLNDDTMLWQYLLTEKGMNKAAFWAETNATQLQLMTDYILDEVVVYKFLHEIYGVFAYCADAPEVIAHGEGDCHSRTMVLVSFFIYMGYDAYACEAPLHWYPMVNLGGVQHYYYRVNWTDPTFMFNDKAVVFRLNPIQALIDVMFHRSLNEIGYVLQAPIAWLPILPLAFFGLGSLFTVISNTGEKLTKKDFLKKSLMTTVVLLMGTLVALTLFQLLPQSPLFIMLMGIVVSMRLLHEDYFFKKDVVNNKKKEKSSL